MDAKSPLCSWSGRCRFNEETKNECAQALCEAQGYIGGTFVFSSNNFCTSPPKKGDPNDPEYGPYRYFLKMSADYAGEIQPIPTDDTTNKAALIIADCNPGIE